MKRLSPTFRLSLSATLLAASLVLIAELIGFVPASRSGELQARRQSGELLAVQLSFAATRSDTDLIDKMLEAFVARNEGVLSAAMRRANGEFVSQTQNHAANWMPVENDRSTATQILVPVLSGEQRWGSVEVRFAPLDEGIFGWLRNSIWGLVLFLVAIGLPIYYGVLRRALREIDPRGTIPQHIKSAFDVLAEGVLILDDRGWIVLANAAFASKSGRPANSLIGVEAARLEWRDIDMRESPPQALPWNRALAHGAAQTGVLLRLAGTGGGATQTFVTNSAPIMDGQGHARGTIVTFDDITALEKKNEELKATIDLLHQSERSLAKLAACDPLTECLNRRSFFDAFEPLCESVESEKRELSCLMLDIDYFKSVNDRFGHDVGDKVIKWTAETIQAHVGPDALVCRYGGEEFCAALPDAGLFPAYGIAQQIRRAIEENAIVRFGQELPVTVSIGLTSATPGAKATTASLITQADKALYVAKASGRNRVTRWSAETMHNIEPPRTARSSTRTHERDAASETNAAAAGARPLPRGSDTTLGAGYAEFVERIENTLGGSECAKRRMAVLSVVPNQFRRVSDTFGPIIADALLDVVGQRLHAVLRSLGMSAAAGGKIGSLVARLGMDEIGVILTDISGRDEIDRVVNAAFRALSQPVEIGGHVVEIGISIGVALTPEGGGTPETLLKNAATARHHAQERSPDKRCEFYSNEMSVTSMRRARIVSELQRALDDNRLVLNFQPQRDVHTGEIATWEALLRWQHPELGAIEPSEIIPIAERTGLIHGLGRWVLRTACLKARAWSDTGLGAPRVAVNLSAVQLQQPDIVAQIREVLAQTGLAPERLEIEITESALIQDQKLAGQTLRQLKEVGIRIAIDDFGIGYSALSYIKDYPVDVVKVDRSFLANVLVDPRASNLYSAIVGMARQLSLYVVAEGIESMEVFDFVNRCGCDAVQGYLFCKPIESLQVAQVLRDNCITATTTGGSATARPDTSRKSLGPSVAR